MNEKTKKIIFWSILVLFFIFGPGLNLVIEKKVPLNFAIERLLVGPLPVKTYLVLLGILTFICGEIVLAQNTGWLLWSCFVLIFGWMITRYYYFLLLFSFSFIFLIIIFIKKRKKQDTIHEILDTVMANEITSQEENVINVNEEPEISFEPEPSLADAQQEEINEFIDSLFDNSKDVSTKQEPLQEPLANEILSDANDFLVETILEDGEKIEKEPPKAVVLEKKSSQPCDDLLEEELSKREDSLGEFDEEIPLDDLVE